MPDKLKSWNEMIPELKEKAIMLYTNIGLPRSFRKIMDELFIKVPWDLLSNEQKIVEAQKMIHKEYSARTDQESLTLLNAIKDRNFMNRLLTCLENEFSLYKTYSKQRQSYLSRSKSSYSLRQSPSYTASASTFKPEPSFPQNQLATLLINGGRHCMNRITEYRGHIAQPSEFEPWFDECIKLLNQCEQVRLLLVQDLQTWNLNKRRSMNLIKGKEDEQLFITQVNEIEIYAQDAVKLLVDLLELCVSQSKIFQQYAIKFMWLQQSARGEILRFVQDSFIVWQQSHQVLRSKNKFAVDVRLLVGPVLPLGTNVGEVEVKVYEEDDSAPDGVGRLSGKTEGMTSASFEVDARPEKLCVAEMNVDNSGRLGQKSSQTNGTSGTKMARRTMPEKGASWIAKFRYIKWINDDGRRTGKETDKSVTETRYAAVFETTVRFAGDSGNKVRCASLPMALFVHLSQGRKSHGNIFWYNAFSYLDQGRFKSPERVTWEQFITEIVRWLCSHTGAQQLAAHNKNFISKCLLDKQDDKVTFARFYTDKQAGPLSFNFWEWISGVCELICSDSLLKFLWQKEAVYGFAESSEAEKLIEQANNKHQCVLLRFGTKPARVQSAKSSKEQPVGIVIMVVNSEDRISKVEALSKAQLQENNLYVRLVSEQLKRPYMLQRTADEHSSPVIIEWLEHLLTEYTYYISETQTDCELDEIQGTHYVKTEETPFVKDNRLPLAARCNDLDQIEPTIPPDLPIESNLAALDLANAIGSTDDSSFGVAP